MIMEELYFIYLFLDIFSQLKLFSFRKSLFMNKLPFF